MSPDSPMISFLAIVELGRDTFNVGLRDRVRIATPMRKDATVSRQGRVARLRRCRKVSLWVP
jgi:hypothetical protein